MRDNFERNRRLIGCAVFAIALAAIILGSAALIGGSALLINMVEG
jgi:formate/nitrite transporter FocA (FNT family)